MGTPRTGRPARGDACLAVATILAAALCTAVAVAQEYPKSAWDKLDTFEAHSLAKADQAYRKQQWRRAAVEYDAFILEFPKSSAIPYTLLKRGRAMQQDDKRFRAIELYNELLDYFPNDIEYAALALYYIGDCHWKNGDIDKAMKAWLEMAQDADYGKHVMAAHALNSLADNLKKQGKMSKAVKYYEQVAVTFRGSNPGAAFSALQQVVGFYMSSRPDEPKIREFYKQAGGFGQTPQAIPADLEQNRSYWQQLWGLVWSHGKFSNLQQDNEQRYFRYWATPFEGRFPDWDDYQITLAAFELKATGDTEKWLAHLDRQFEANYKAGDWRRVCQWMRLFKAHKAKVVEYYNKLVVAKMDLPEIEAIVRMLHGEFRNAELVKKTFDAFYSTVVFEEMKKGDIRRLMLLVYDTQGDREMARNILLKLGLGEMPDGEKLGLIGELWGRDVEMAVELCRMMKDKERGQLEQLRFYHGRREAGPALPFATALTGSERFAKEAWWKKAECLQWLGKHADAIDAYRMCDNHPTDLWRIVDCYLALGKAAEAIQQLEEIEAFFKDQAPQAALRIAFVCRDTGDRQAYVANLRGVLKKYPGSSQSSAAHELLEKMGIKTGGAIDAD